MNRKLLIGLVVAIALVFSIHQKAEAVSVGLELALLVDVSGSISLSEYALQKQGYVNAFKDATIQANIGTITGGIAVTYIEWSGGTSQLQRVGWTLINNVTTANAFADAIDAITTRAFNGNTAPGSAINFAKPLFDNNGFEGSRLVMDVSGDGPENEGADTSTAATAAFNSGITINGLTIGGGTLPAWYQANIVGPGGGFLVQAINFADFEAAVKTKIGREIQVPEPGTILLLGIGLLGLARFGRKRIK